MHLCRLYRISLDELCGYSANSVDAMRLSDSGQRVKVYARRKERRYLADSVLDLSTDEQQLLAYYRSASPEDRAELFEHLRNARYRDRRHANENNLQNFICACSQLDRATDSDISGVSS